jgi:hypothetical protein
MKPMTIFSGTSGLNTVADPARIPMGKNGMSDVAAMVNLRVDQYGRPSKRVGLTLLVEGDFHSLYCDNGDCLVAMNRATDTAIFQVAADGTISGIRSGLKLGERIAFKQHVEKTYYSNGYQSGVIESGRSKPWVVGEYQGVDTDRFFSIPDKVNHLGIHNSRMYASSGNVLWWSEPFRPDLFDMARSFVNYRSKILMVKSVAAGVFVSTERNTYIILGDNPNEFQQVKVAGFPAVEWSDAIEYVDGGDIGFDPGLYALWSSTEGAILGVPSGQIINLTKAKIIYPESTKTGFGCLMGYNFIHGMQ